MSVGAGTVWRKVGGRGDEVEDGSGWVARSGGCGGVVMVGGLKLVMEGLCAGCLGWGGEFRDGGVRDWRRSELALSPVRY